MSCVVSVVGICASDDGLKTSPSQNAQTPPNDKHVGHGDPCLILRFLIRFNTTAPFRFCVINLFSVSAAAATLLLQ